MNGPTTASVLGPGEAAPARAAAVLKTVQGHMVTLGQAGELDGIGSGRSEPLTARDDMAVAGDCPLDVEIARIAGLATEDDDLGGAHDRHHLGDEHRRHAGLAAGVLARPLADEALDSGLRG